MKSTYNPGRVAGVLYLLLGVAVVRPIYIANALIVRNNADATAGNIAAHELLFRFGIVSDLLAGIFCIFLALALYRTLKGVDQNLAAVMVILGGVMPAALDFFNVLNDVAALLLVRGEDFLSVFEKPQRDALAMLFLRLHEHGFLANQVFAGLWLFPFGLLVYRSGFLPRILGVCLFIAGSGYLVNTLTDFLFPQYADTVIRFAAPAFLGEGPILLWLLIKGSRPQPLSAAV
jgi:hypothetical protein